MQFQEELLLGHHAVAAHLPPAAPEALLLQLLDLVLRFQYRSFVPSSWRDVL